MRDDTLSDAGGARPDANRHPYEPETPGLSFRSCLLAVRRYKWLLALAFLAGLPGAYVAWTNVPVRYTARGSLWLEVEPGRRGADAAPIRGAGLTEATGWIELLRSFQVLEPVVVEHKLYVRAPEESAPAFASFTLAEEFAPGSYELRVGAAGDGYVLLTARGQLVQHGVFGEPIGRNVGFVWNPSRGSFPAGKTVEFSVLSVRDAAQDISNRLYPRLDREGSFLQLALNGSDPQETARTLNALMERHVSLAADLKRTKLNEGLEILTKQLATVERALARAEQDVEEFRVRTISLPSDRSMPAIAPLRITRDPVFEEYFEYRVAVEQLSRDRARLQAALDGWTDDPVLIETLEVIEAAAESPELRHILEELVHARSELGALRDRYAEDYPPIRDLIVRITLLETVAVPQVVRGIIDELEAREQEAQRYVDQAATQLQEIPPRTIEEGRLLRRVQTTENLYRKTRDRLDAARLAVASAVPDVRILDRAAVPRRPSGDMRLPIAAAILFGFLGVAVAGALVLDRADSRSRGGENVGADIPGRDPRTARRHGAGMWRFGEELVPMLAIIGGSALGVVATGFLVLSPSGEAPPVVVPSATDRTGAMGDVWVQSVDGTLRQPHRVVAVVGDEQVAHVGELLPVRPTVIVVDQAGRPLPGVDVHFEMKSGGGLIAPARAQTDSFGRASAVWRLGMDPGIQKISASSPGLVTVVTFTATARR